MALGSDCQRLFEQLTRIQPGQTFALAQVALSVWVQTPTGFRDGNSQANGSEGVLQLTAFAHVHVHIAAGQERQVEVAADRFDDGEAFAISSVAQQLDCYPYSFSKAFREPVGLGSLD